MKKTAKLPQARFAVEGFSYRPVEKSEVDIFSIQHLLVHDSDGEIFKPDFTPWCYMSKVDVQNYINLGMPCRLHEYRPLSSNDLRKMLNSTNR